MEINPEFYIGDKVRLKISQRKGIVLNYVVNDSDLMYNIRHEIDEKLVVTLFTKHELELVRKYNG